MLSTIFRSTTSGSLTAAAACILALGACDDPTSLRADLPTEDAALLVHALTGTPPGRPAAISVPANQAVILDGNLFYDVVFDLDNEGRAILYPMELTAWPRVGTHRVGLLKSAGTFATVTHAPADGYVFDESLVVAEGDVIIVESQEPRVCIFPFPTRMYARIGIDQIDLVARTLRVSMTLNPNCGFRSFLPGIPTD
jgi:hypothetical protein